MLVCGIQQFTDVTHATLDASLHLKKLATSCDRHLHDEVFYENFRRILMAAEKLGIYAVPGGPNKYSMSALRRFAQWALFIEAPFHKNHVGAGTH